METSPKTYTLESLTELIRQDPKKAFEEIQKMPDEEARYFLGALPFEESGEIFVRGFVANLDASIEAKVKTP